MVQNSPKWSKIKKERKKGPSTSQTVPNGLKCSQIVSNCENGFKGFQMYQKVSKALDYLNCFNLTKWASWHAFASLLHQALELEINMWGIWKKHVKQIIRGVTEKKIAIFSFYIFSFTSAFQIWFHFYSMLKIEWVILPSILNFLRKLHIFVWIW